MSCRIWELDLRVIGFGIEPTRKVVVRYQCLIIKKLSGQQHNRFCLRNFIIIGMLGEIKSIYHSPLPISPDRNFTVAKHIIINHSRTFYVLLKHFLAIFNIVMLNCRKYKGNLFVRQNQLRLASNFSSSVDDNISLSQLSSTQPQR